MEKSEHPPYDWNARSLKIKNRHFTRCIIFSKSRVPLIAHG
jgi:hypothetical protein